MKILIKLVQILIFSGIVYSQSLVTDRPDFTESPFSIKWKSFQFESGIVISGDKFGNEIILPNLLSRIGLGKGFELRLGFPTLSIIKEKNQLNTYLNDLAIELKYQITGFDEEMPITAILTSSFPTGHGKVSSGENEFGLKLATAIDLSDAAGIGFNLGTNSIKEGEKRVWDFLASASLGVQINEKFSTFFEVYALYPANKSWEPVFDCGDCMFKNKKDILAAKL